MDTGTIRAFLEERHVGLVERLSEFVQARIAPVPPAHDDAEARLRARDLLGILGSSGWLESIRDQDYRACCLAREALAGVSPLADAVFALQALSATPLVLAGSAGLRDRWVPELVSGSAMGAFAMTEPDAGSDVAALGTTARREGTDYVLDGCKHLISNAGVADVYVVFARTDADTGRRGISAFLVEAATPGLRFAGPQILAEPHPLGRIELDGCRVPADHRIGEEGRGFGLGMATLDRLRPTVAAAACGMAARALDEAARHALERQQFGQPLADFQIVQGKLGRMAMDLDAARLTVYRAAWARDQGADRTTVEAAVAKAFATEAAQRIVDDAVQLVGGRGVLVGHPVERLYRAVRALRIYEGTTEIQHLIIAGALLDRLRRPE